MSNLSRVFENGKAFIGFITAGDPDLETTGELILSMEKGGADLIELGIPFSDPVAEGPVIQRASMRALKEGATTDKIFDMVKRVRIKTKIPLAFMTYVNVVFTYGTGRFLRKCRELKIDALILPDLPFEEKGELSSVCHENSVDLISLIAPTSHERISRIAKEAEGFVYCVSSMGVTGVRNEISDISREMVTHVKEVKDIPCAIGFGISTPNQARKAASYADGVIVGSAIVKIVEKYGKNSIEPVFKYVQEMKMAIANELI